MSVDEQHLAFPKLYKAPAYARPPAPVDPTDRPFDPDELPILAEQTPEERAIAEAVASGGIQSWPALSAMPPAPEAGAYLTPTPPPVVTETLAPAPAPAPVPAPASALTPRPFSIRSFADRLRHRSEDK